MEVWKMIFLFNWVIFRFPHDLWPINQGHQEFQVPKMEGFLYLIATAVLGAVGFPSHKP